MRISILIEILKQEQTEILQIKNLINQILKKSLMGLTSRLD